MVTIFQLTDWPSESERVPTSPTSKVDLHIYNVFKVSIITLHHYDYINVLCL